MLSGLRSLARLATATAASATALLRAPQTLMAQPLMAQTQASPLLIQAQRGCKYTSNSKKRLPGYILPRQSEPTAILKKMHKFKFFRLKRGKAGQRPIGPNYGRDDSILGKMRI
ncbi:hypothetical protein BC831DRAFT_469811 [Entophlyctis helioformis]|nr:hypothetical protein BC831DRAFT_469811 [Entophlyctis helioformis]